MRSSACTPCQLLIEMGCVGNSYFEHNHGVSTDNDHANADLLAAGPLLKRLVEHNVQVDLAKLDRFVSNWSCGQYTHHIRGGFP
jgi:hypothetical protein